jgi:hypothetical protein
MNLEHVSSFGEQRLHPRICLRLLRSEAQISQRGRTARLRLVLLIRLAWLLLARPRSLARSPGLRDLATWFWRNREIIAFGRMSRCNCRGIWQGHGSILRLCNAQVRKRHEIAAKGDSLKSNCSSNNHPHHPAPSPSNLTLLGGLDS